MCVKVFDLWVGWDVFKVLIWNGVFFLENEICILNIKLIFVYCKYFFNMYLKI